MARPLEDARMSERRIGVEAPPTRPKAPRQPGGTSPHAAEKPGGFREDAVFKRCVPPYPADYTDAAGVVLYRVASWLQAGMRTFSTHHPCGTGGWLEGRGDAPRVLFRLPEVKATISSGKTVHVVGNEAKVHALEGLGVCATCCDGGAGTWRREHSAGLRGARCVVIWVGGDGLDEHQAASIAHAVRAQGVQDVRIPRPQNSADGSALDQLLAQIGTHSSERSRQALAGLVATAAPADSPLPNTPNEAVRGRAHVTRLADVEPLSIDWLWKGWLALGMLSILDGDPGQGKSTFLLELAARLSRGDRMPDGSPGPPAAGVALLSAEDDLARVIRPRLEAAGADLGRVVTLGIKTARGLVREPTISPEDVEIVESTMLDSGTKLLIIDPLVAYLTEDTNANRDQDVRRALALLRGLAERTKAAVVVVRHLNKRVGAAALYRGGGSIGIIAAARTGLLLAPDPDAPAGPERILAVEKSNLASKPPALRLRLVDDPGTNQSRIQWCGTTHHTATTLLAEPTTVRDRSPIDEAVEFINDQLTAGPIAATEVQSAAHDAGISPATLNRAKRRCDVVSRKAGGPSGEQSWFWELPGKRLDEGSHSGPGDHLHASEGRKPNSGLDKAEDDQQRQAENLEEPVPGTESLDKNGTPRASSPESPRSVFDVPTWADPPIRNGQDTCPTCGGRVISWDFGVVCSGCHQTVGPAVPPPDSKQPSDSGPKDGTNG